MASLGAQIVNNLPAVRDREGNGTPIQNSSLKNSRDGGTWWAIVYVVAQSRTRLKRLSSSSARHLGSIPGLGKLSIAVFVAALFTIARTRTQPRCPSTEKWAKKM